MKWLKRLRGCQRWSECIEGYDHDGPCFNGRCCMFPGPAVRLTPIDELMNAPGPATGRPAPSAGAATSDGIQSDD